MAIESQNIYKNARKSAGFTQEKASQLLNVSVDSLRDYEQSQRPVPSDVASAMCDVYQAPYLAVQHLRLTSDLGKRVVPEIQLKDLPEAVLGVLAAVQRFCAKREAMVEIAADGQIAESEQAEWDEIMRLANDLNVAMQPFEDFDEVYKECVTDVYGPADEALKGKIADVEAGLKADKEKKVKDYFAEMVKASGVEWVTYEDVGVAVTLTASLKSLKAKVKEYVEKVAADVACINGMENAPEIMAEYKLCGSLAVAINSVSQRKDRIAREEAERKQRLEAQLRAQEAEKAVLDVAEEELSAPQVIGTEPPVMDEQETEDSQKESTEQVVTAKFTFMASTFQCRGTLAQLRGLKAFVNSKITEIQAYMTDNGIENREVSDNG